MGLALEEKPTVELTVDCVQIFGTKVDWEQVLKGAFLRKNSGSQGYDSGNIWQEDGKE